MGEQSPERSAPLSVVIRKWAIRVGIAVLVFEVCYLIAANVFLRTGLGIGISFSTPPANHPCVPASPPLIGTFRAPLVNTPHLGNLRLRGARFGGKNRPTPALSPHLTQAPAGGRSRQLPRLKRSRLPADPIPQVGLVI